MSLLVDEERREKAKSLIEYKNDIDTFVRQGKAIRLQLNEFKDTINADVVGEAKYFTAADVTDVDTILAHLDTEIAKI